MFLSCGTMTSKIITSLRPWSIRRSPSRTHGIGLRKGSRNPRSAYDVLNKYHYVEPENNMNNQAEKYLQTLDRLPNTLKTYRWALSYYFDLAGEVLSDEAYEKFLAAIRNLSPSSKRVL